MLPLNSTSFSPLPLPFPITAMLLQHRPTELHTQITRWGMGSTIRRGHAPGTRYSIPWKTGIQQITLPWSCTSRSRQVIRLLPQFSDYSYCIKLEITALGAFGRKMLHILGLERCSATKIPFDQSSAAPHGQLLLTLNFRNASWSRPWYLTAKTPSLTKPKSGVTLTPIYFTFKVSWLSRNKHHVDKAHNYTFAGCPPSNHLLHWPSSLLIN